MNESLSGKARFAAGACVAILLANLNYYDGFTLTLRGAVIVAIGVSARLN